MTKDITEDILLKAEFKKVSEIIGYYTTYERYPIDITHLISANHGDRDWFCEVHGNFTANIDIQTIDHFNKLMELMDIDLKL